MLQRVTLSSFNRLMTKNAHSIALERKASARRQLVRRLHDIEGMSFQAIADHLGGMQRTRVYQLYQSALYRNERDIKQQAKAKAWKSIAASLADELSKREAIFRDLNYDRAIRNASMPRQQPKPYDIIFTAHSE